MIADTNDWKWISVYLIDLLPGCFSLPFTEFYIYIYRVVCRSVRSFVRSFVLVNLTKARLFKRWKLATTAAKRIETK